MSSRSRAGLRSSSTDEDKLDIPYYYKSVDWDQLVQDYPPPPIWQQTNGTLSDDDMRALQERRFLARMDDAWRVAFYRDRWSDAGLEPGDINGLDDLDKIPTFTSADLKDAIDAAPPFGSHQPQREDLGKLPIKIQTSGGTTGLPRVTLFDPVSWEVQGIQTARAYSLAGGRPGDIVQITFTTSLANAGWSAYQGAHNWAGMIPMTTGSGVVTSTERQLEYARAWGTNGWYSMGEYLGRIAEVAAAENFDLRQLPTKFLLAGMGTDPNRVFRRQLEEAWGAPVFDFYGTHEIGFVAYECQSHDGLHVQEDTVVLQTLDVEDGSPIEHGGMGDLVATSLHRSLPPIIRFNLHDKLILYPRSECTCGLTTLKLSNFLGRSDQMIKLRGSNVYPMAAHEAVLRDTRTTGEFLCVARTVGSGVASRTEMTVQVERRDRTSDKESMQQTLANELGKDFGVRVDVEIVEAGELQPHTQVGGEGKPRRLLDLRVKK